MVARDLELGQHVGHVRLLAVHDSRQRRRRPSLRHCYQRRVPRSTARFGRIADARGPDAASMRGLDPGVPGASSAVHPAVRNPGSCLRLLLKNSVPVGQHPSSQSDRQTATRDEQVGRLLAKGRQWPIPLCRLLRADPARRPACHGKDTGKAHINQLDGGAVDGRPGRWLRLL
eukprot:scaffold9750_cov116-Isochrysis_galbana.AAC.4